MIVLLLVGLSTWRVSSLLIREDGPWSIFNRLRAWAGVYRPGEVTPLAELFSCVWCVSVWVACIHTLIAWAFGLTEGSALYFLLFASSAIAITLDVVVEYLTNTKGAS